MELVIMETGYNGKQVTDYNGKLVTGYNGKIKLLSLVFWKYTAVRLVRIRPKKALYYVEMLSNFSYCFIGCLRDLCFNICMVTYYSCTFKVNTYTKTINVLIISLKTLRSLTTNINCKFHFCKFHFFHAFR